MREREACFFPLHVNRWRDLFVSKFRVGVINFCSKGEISSDQKKFDKTQGENVVRVKFSGTITTFCETRSHSYQTLISLFFWFLLLSFAILKYRQYFLMLQTLKLYNKKWEKIFVWQRKKFSRIDSWQITDYSIWQFYFPTGIPISRIYLARLIHLSIQSHPFWLKLRNW